MSQFLDAAAPIVREAGQAAKRMISQSHTQKLKEGGDFVTDGDLFVEKQVISALKRMFPDHGYDSEERGQENAGAEYVWILDPIDGTKYYSKDVPLYSVSLALAHRGRLILGVVYSPDLDRLYCASEGEGATLNGRSITCSKEDRLENAHICLEIPNKHHSSDERRWALEKMFLLVEKSYRVRMLGVSALGLCFCAAGGFDAYVNLGSPWKDCDNAAGQVILGEAGGEFYRTGRHIVGGPVALCDKIKGLLSI